MTSGRDSVETVESLLEHCRQNGRVCPQPRHWNRLWELLPNKKRIGMGWDPALPIILLGWSAPDSMKADRLREHIEWADKFGALETVAKFLRGLPEEDWHHSGE